jgi:hypothetical protein
MTMPTPPYPVVDNAVLGGIVKTSLLKFEEGQISVAGAILAAAQSAWAVGHQEGEDLCVGCTHRLVENLPKRLVPHASCMMLTLKITEQSMKTYIETWMILVKQGAVGYPQSEAEMRGAFTGMTNTLQALLLLVEQAIKKGTT